MADDNKFFRWLGRINSLLFFAGILGLIAVVGIPALLWMTTPRESPITEKATSDKDHYVFSGSGLSEVTYSTIFTRLNGTDEGIAVLQHDGGEGNPYSLSRSRRTYDNGVVNLLSIDLKTMKNRWVFHGVKRDIGNIYQIRVSVPVPENAADPVTALLMAVADKDTNGDGSITPSDRHALYVYRLNGAAPVKLIDTWLVSGVEQLDGERIVVTYYDGKTDHAVLLSAKDFRMIANTLLSASPK